MSPLCVCAADKLPKDWLTEPSPSQKAIKYVELFGLACFWDIPALKQMLEREVCETMTPETAAYALALAQPVERLQADPAYNTVFEFQVSVLCV